MALALDQQLRQPTRMICVAERVILTPNTGPSVSTARVTSFTRHGRVSMGSRLVQARRCCKLVAMAGMASTVVAFTATEEEEEISTVKTAADETLEMLEWPSLCDAVARFATTAIGRKLSHALKPPSTQEESQMLLDQTSAGLELDALLGGVLDFGGLQTPAVKSGLDRASKGVVISGQELAAIATLLQEAHAFQRRILSLLQDNKGANDQLQPIAKLVEPMVIHQDLYKLIWSKIDEDGNVKDTASPQLRQARIQAQSIEQKLQELLNKFVREKSGDDDAQDIIFVDGRLCLMVAAERANSIPGLLFQQSGTTAYLEPSQAVSLNNKLAEARVEVQKAEYDVLSGVVTKIMPHLNDIDFALHTIVHLDMIAARGKYSSWIGGRKAIFVSCRQPMESDGGQNERDTSYLQHELLINLRKARHPLLVEKHYHALRKVKAKLKAKSKLLSRMRSRAGTTTASMQSMVAEVAEVEVEVANLEARAPVPIDVQIRQDTRVVAITGPNTGGKTATMKAIGLAALMAKVGLYVLAIDPVCIPWFDSVFADIGDEQSLSQSLSTFSGHLLRIKRIKSESTGDSLVLLDEVGAGTDPTEGAALGMALLESFAKGGAGGSLLTLATTHHGELKTLKYSDKRFENASVEFDEERLAPTYKLLWGVPGRSNALNIARRLGLPSAILQKAQSLYGTATAELNEVIMKLEETKVDFDRSCEQSEILTKEIKEFQEKLEITAQRLYEHEEVLHLEKCEQLAEIASAARSRVSAIARMQSPKLPQSTATVRLQGTQLSPSQNAGRIFRDKHLISNKVHVADQIRKSRLKSSDIPMPRIGQLVYVPKLQRDVKVVALNASRKEITVQSGLLQIKVGLKDLQRP